MASASFIPRSFGLDLYAGDGAQLLLTITDQGGLPVTLTGAVTAEIRAKRSDAEPLAEFEVEVTGNEILLSLSGADTASLGSMTGQWDCQWQATDAEPKTLLTGSVTCRQDVTRV